MKWLSELIERWSSVEREIITDEKQRMAIGKERVELWKRHLANYAAKYRMYKQYFHHTVVDNTLQDTALADSVLAQVESLISTDQTILDKDEEDAKSETARFDEIMGDVNRIDEYDTGSMVKQFIDKFRTKDDFISHFKAIHDILVLELRMVWYARKILNNNNPNIKILLGKLYRLIYPKESTLYAPFEEEMMRNKSVHKEIAKLVEAVFMGKEFRKKEKDADDEFALEISEKMNPNLIDDRGEANEYRELGEEIFEELGRMAWKNMPDAEDYSEIVTKMDNMVDKGSTLKNIITRLIPNHPRLNINENINAFVKAFRDAYDKQHFDDMVADLEDLKAELDDD